MYRADFQPSLVATGPRRFTAESGSPSSRTAMSSSRYREARAPSPPTLAYRPAHPATYHRNYSLPLRTAQRGVGIPMPTGCDVLDFTQFRRHPYDLDEDVLREIYGLVPVHYRPTAPTRLYALRLMEAVLVFTNRICPGELRRSSLRVHLPLRELCQCLSTLIPREFVPLHGSVEHRFFTALIAFLRRHQTRTYSSPPRSSFNEKEVAEMSSIRSDYASQSSSVIRGQGHSSQTSQSVSGSMVIKLKHDREDEGPQKTEKKNEKHLPTAPPEDGIVKKRKKSLTEIDNGKIGKHDAATEGSPPARKKHKKEEKDKKGKKEDRERKANKEKRGKRKDEETSEATSQKRNRSVHATSPSLSGVKVTSKKARHRNDLLNEDTRPEALKSRSSNHPNSKSRGSAGRRILTNREAIEETSASSENDLELEEDHKPVKRRRPPQNTYNLMYNESQEEVRFLQNLLEQGAGLTSDDIKACKVRVGRGRTFRYAFEMVFRAREGQQRAPRAAA